MKPLPKSIELRLFVADSNKNRFYSALKIDLLSYTVHVYAVSESVRCIYLVAMFSASSIMSSLKLPICSASSACSGHIQRKINCMPLISDSNRYCWGERPNKPLVRTVSGSLWPNVSGKQSANKPAINDTAENNSNGSGR